MKRRPFHALALLATFACGLAQAGADLETLKARGVLRCGVSDDIPGFAERDVSGRWRGMNVDYCRAVAAAVLGNPEKVDFVPLKASQRFPALQAKTIDLLVRNTTWTLTREAALKVQFPAVLFHDGQGFMVPASARLDSPDQLKGSRICVEKGTTHEKRLVDYFTAHGTTVTPVVVDSATGAADALYAGRCQAYSSDASQLAAMRTRAPGGAAAFTILPQRISKEPMGPVVRNGDPEWATLVGWVRHALVAAEEHGITRDNVDARVAGMRGGIASLLTGQNELVSRSLGVQRDWALRAVRAVGNYGEVYERNLGKDTPLAIERGDNRSWTEGGLMYAPPID